MPSVITSGWLIRCSACGRRCYASIYIQWAEPDRHVRIYSFCARCSKMRAPTPAELKAAGKKPGEFWEYILNGGCDARPEAQHS
jgi:hypothetical protein